MIHESYVFEIETPPEMHSDAAFADICRKNENLRIERESDGKIIAMPPTGFETGRRNSAIITDLSLWNRQNQLGEVGDSSTGYTFPNFAIRSPDASWISHQRLGEVSMDDRQGFVHAVPEFVVEIRSISDRPRVLREKMEEYIRNGVLLAWYIDLPAQLIEIYRANGEIDAVAGFEGQLTGETVLPQFVFDLKWLK